MSYNTFFQYVLMNSRFKPRHSVWNIVRNVNSLNNNPYLEKYSEKLAEAQKRPPEEFKESLRKNLNLNQECSLLLKNKEQENLSKKEGKLSYSQGQKDLNQIMKLEAVQDKTAEEIETIWMEYHKNKDGIYAVLPDKLYSTIHSNLKEYPIFLFPLPQAQGYEFIMCQFLDQSCYFTSLVNYQAFKENAPVCLTITYFTEFQKDKGIVLMRGEYSSPLKVYEAQCLANQLQLYYGGQDEKKFQLLYKFNKQPDTFKHMDLINNLESGFTK